MTIKYKKRTKNKKSKTNTNSKKFKKNIKSKTNTRNLFISTPATPATIHVSYPYYRNNYKLNVSRIKKLIKYLPRQLYISKLPPQGYKTYNNFKPFINNEYRNPSYYMIKTKWNETLELNNLTDYFTEDCRVRCVFKDNLSPLEYWKKNYNKLISGVIKSGHPANNYWLREEIYKNTKLCSNFRIALCLEILNIFKPKKWLDISAGWGDRLLSALLHNDVEYYCGVDPNPCLHPYYQEIIKTFGDKNKECLLIQNGFVEAKLPDIEFDLVFSSPPFFDLEIYSKANNNSVTKYSNEQSWFNGFLMPSLYKAYEKLRNNGYLILYMGESKGTKYIPQMCKLLDQNMRNAGMIYYSDTFKIREFYCWQKTQ
jgi:hypothetical protein